MSGQRKKATVEEEEVLKSAQQVEVFARHLVNVEAARKAAH